MNSAADDVVAINLQAANNTARMTAASAESYAAVQRSIATRNSFASMSWANF
jgi:hypothetical protein